MEYYAILTEAGLATIANAPVTGLPLRFEKFAVGDGGGEEYAPQASQTALKNTCWEGAVASVRADAENPNIVEVRAVLPSTAGGFVVRELGLLNENGVLVAVANCPPTSKVLLSDGVTSEMEVGMQIAVSGTEHISLTVDPTVILVTQKVLDNAMKSHNADPDVHSGLMEAHNADPDAHSGLMEAHNADPDAHSELMESHNADPEAHGGGMVVTLTHAKSGTTHAFTGLGAREGLVPCQFKSTAGYTEGDTATIDGTPYTIVLTGADQPETDLFVSGKSILADVDTESKTINFKAGGGLTKAKLALATATEATVFNGKTFYGGDSKELRTGTALATATSVAAGNLFNGKTAYDNNGNLITGTALSQAVNVTANNIPSGVTAYNQAGQRITGNGSGVFKYLTGEEVMDRWSFDVSCNFTVRAVFLYGRSTVSAIVCPPLTVNPGGSSSVSWERKTDFDLYQGKLSVSNNVVTVAYYGDDPVSIGYMICGT